MRSSSVVVAGLLCAVAYLAAAAAGACSSESPAGAVGDLADTGYADTDTSDAPTGPPGCFPLVPGCDEGFPLPAAGCYLECAPGDTCPEGEECRYVSRDPCADPGDRCTACAAFGYYCVPIGSFEPSCAARGPDSCELDELCRVLAPGCVSEGAPPLPAASCFPADPCELDDDCGDGERCRSFTVDPCYGEPCGTCGAETTACVSEGVPDLPCPTRADETSCQEDGACAWHEPGCTGIYFMELSETGCYQPCTDGSECAPGLGCWGVPVGPGPGCSDPVYLCL